MEQAGDDRAVMIGDSTWDCEAAKRAGIPAIAILTGGFSEQELRDAGAVAVYESIPMLAERLDARPLT
jgi:phosphoglycolate phosphatase-like HAD superfamily hydrolase